MVIIWKDKPYNYDTRMVTSVWFDEKKPTVAYYTIDGSNYTHTAKTKEIDKVVTEDVYTQLKRLPPAQTWTAGLNIATERVIARLERQQLDAEGEPVYGLYLNGRVIGCMTLAAARAIYGDHLDVVGPGAPSNDAALGSQDLVRGTK